MPPVTDTCTEIAFIGARGSGEDPQGNPPAFGNDPSLDFGNEVEGLYNGFVNKFTAEHNDANQVKPLTVQYPAAGVDEINFLTATYIDSIYEGVGLLEAMIQNEEVNCPSEKLVLAGYSQGALVVHIALLQLDQTDPAALDPSHLAAVLLIADPAKVADGAEETWQSALTLAQPSVQNADGLWTKLSGGVDSGPLPPSVVGLTLAMCHNKDIVCAPGFGSSPTQHTNYSSSEETDMGFWAADLYLGLPLPGS